MRYTCLMLSRFALAAWLGAAVFFVSVALRPMSSPLFDSEHKAHLPLLFFPGYYAFEFTLLGVALLAGLCARGDASIRPRMFDACLLLLTLALGCAVADWFWIYSPLADMLRLQIAQHTAPPASFRGYHVASRHINETILVLGAAAAILVHWPSRQPRPGTEKEAYQRS